MANLYLYTTTVDKLSLFAGLPIGLATVGSNIAKTILDIGQLALASYRCRRSAPSKEITQNRIKAYTEAQQNFWQHITFIAIGVLRMTHILAPVALVYNNWRAQRLIEEGDKNAAKDIVKDAVEIYQKAVEINGSADPMVKMSNIYVDYEITPFNPKDEASVRAAAEQDWKLSFQWAKRAGQTGEAKGLKDLAESYQYGIGTPVDKAKALECYLKAAKKGDLDSMVWVGYMYYQAKEYDKGAVWFQKLAIAGHPILDGEIAKAIMHQIANDSSLDPAKKQKLIDLGIEWLRKAAVKQCPEAFYLLGLFTRDGNYGMPKSERNAFSFFWEGALLNHSKSQYIVAEMFLNGKGYLNGDLIAKNSPAAKKQAFEWCEKAAKDKNCAAAQNQLATFYATGYGVKKSEKEALKLRQIAADNGNTEAQVEMGDYFYNIDNYELAFKYYGLAADNNDARAQAEVGNVYAYHRAKIPSLQGMSDQEAIKKATEFYTKAANQNNSRACNNLGAILVKQGSVNEGIAQYRKAIALGNDYATKNLAIMYSHGQVKDSNGVLIPENSVEAQTQAHALLKSVIDKPTASKEMKGEAEGALAEFYMVGYGVRKSWSEAYKWTTRAAGNGDEASQARLAKLNTCVPYEHWMYLGLRGQLA